MDGSPLRALGAEPLFEILLVEDNPGDVRLIEEAFEQIQTDVELELATDGTEAVETLSSRQGDSDELPDIVLLDLNLPRMDGFQVLDAVRDDLGLSQLPILVLTTSRNSEDTARSYDRSANACLTKPQSPDELVSLARAIEAFWIENVLLSTT